MPVADGDISFRLSTQSGSAGNTVSSTPAGSIGKYMSTTPILNGSLENLFANVKPEDSTSGKVYHKCLFVANLGAVLWKNAKIWFTTQTPGGGDVAMGIDPIGVQPVGSVSAQAQAPSNQLAAPAGVAYGNPVSQDGAFDLGDIPGGNTIAVWFRLTVPVNASALNLDRAAFRVQGQSEP